MLEALGTGAVPAVPAAARHWHVVNASCVVKWHRRWRGEEHGAISGQGPAMARTALQHMSMLPFRPGGPLPHRSRHTLGGRHAGSCSSAAAHRPSRMRLHMGMGTVGLSGRVGGSGWGLHGGKCSWGNATWA